MVYKNMPGTGVEPARGITLIRPST